MKRNYALDGLRGYAALAVVFYHAILSFDSALAQNILYVPVQNISGAYSIVAKVCLTLFNGESAVSLFFILSGVVLFDSLKRGQDRGIIMATLDFAFKRVLRIYPAVIVCLGFFYGVFYCLALVYPGVFSSFSVNQLIENSMLYKITMHGASWTLQMEMVAVPFILLGYYIYRYFGITALIGYFGYSLLAYDNPSIIINIPPFSLCFAFFAIGFLIPTQMGERIFSALEEKGWKLILPTFIFTRIIMLHESYMGLFVQLMFGYLLVGILYYNNAGSLGVFLQNKISVFLGKISFSLYLYNVIFLNIFCKLMAYHSLSRTHPIEFGILASIATIVFTIPVSCLSEKYVERPFIKFGREISKNLIYPRANDHRLKRDRLA